MDYNVKVTYKNEDGDIVSQRRYTLQEYTGMIRSDLFRVITDVEDLIYLVHGGESKDGWSDSVMLAFNKIKHKLLDKAGDIGRLPETIEHIKEDDEGNLANWIAELFSDTLDE